MRTKQRGRKINTTTDAKVLDIEDILERLPHRFPFLIVDRVLEFKPGKSIVALKNVTFNEAHFTGHFPRHPVMPGVLVLEALAQAGGVLAWETVANREDIRLLYLVGIENARFKQMVRPGDQLVLKVRARQAQAQSLALHGTCGSRRQARRRDGHPDGGWAEALIDESAAVAPEARIARRRSDRPLCRHRSRCRDRAA